MKRAAFLLLLFWGCGVRAPSPFEVSASRTGSAIGGYRFGSVTPEYIAPGALREMAQRKAANMGTPTPTVPAGGVLLLHISNTTIELANLENWDFAVLDSKGKEVLRQKGKFNSPNLPGRYNRNWTNTAGVDIPIEISEGVTVQAFDKRMSERWDFTIKPNKVEQVAAAVAK